MRSKAEDVRVAWGSVPADLMAALIDVDAAVRTGRLEVVKTACSGSATSWKRLLAFGTGESKHLAIKFSRAKSTKKAIYQLLPCRGTMLHTRLSHQAALERQILVPQPIAQGYIGALPHLSFFVMERITGCITLGEVVANHLKPATNPESMKLLRSILAVQLASVHRKGFFHKDIKPCHCFIRLNGHGLEQTLFEPWTWLDLDHLSLDPNIRRRYCRIGNLYQCYRYLLAPFGEADPYAFVAEYLKEMGSSEDPHRLALSVERRFLARGGLEAVEPAEFGYGDLPA